VVGTLSYLETMLDLEVNYEGQVVVRTVDPSLCRLRLFCSVAKAASRSAARYSDCRTSFGDLLELAWQLRLASWQPQN